MGLNQKFKDCDGCPSAKGIRRNGGCCNQQASPVGKSTSPSSINFKLSTGEEWVQATDLGTALANLHRFAKEGKKCRIVAGNTGTGKFQLKFNPFIEFQLRWIRFPNYVFCAGVFKNDGPYEVFLDINNIPDLKVATLEPTGVVLGAGTTLTSAITLLLDASKLPGYEYTAKMSKHLERVANVPVRNVKKILSLKIEKRNDLDAFRKNSPCSALEWNPCRELNDEACPPRFPFGCILDPRSSRSRS